MGAGERVAAGDADRFVSAALAGRYELAGWVGRITLRVMRRLALAMPRSGLGSEMPAQPEREAGASIG